jgi:flagellar assembly protein FliH
MSYEARLQEGEIAKSVPFQYIPTEDEGEASAGDAEASVTILGPFTKAQVAKQVKEAFGRGLAEGENRAKGACAARLTSFQEGVRKAIEAFQTERDEYFRRIEPEVVHLALAIAKKILHRESQIDPLLLTGLVHVALEKLDAGTRVRLKVHPADTQFWNEFFVRSGEATRPELSGDPSLQSGECTLESEVGSTQISLETQLKEIEQGFFDLLEQRPRVR